MLVAKGVTKYFDGVTALDGVAMEVAPGEVVGLVGPNGSGKSTLLSIIGASQRLDSGTVTFGGVRIDRSSPWDVARIGLERTFQLPKMPERMTVLEVMLVGARLPMGGKLLNSFLRPRRTRQEESLFVQRARELLDELTLLGLEHHAAGLLSGGQQKLLSLGAALMADPRLLLLDEPTAGVNPSLRGVLVDRLRSVHSRGTAIVVVEHDMGFVADLCERVYVLDMGKVITCCPPSELAGNPRVVEAYLGTKATRAGVRHRRDAPRAKLSDAAS